MKHWMDGSNDPQVHNLPKKKSLDTESMWVLDGLNDKQYIIKTENVRMDKMRKTKTMSYPRLIKVLNKDLDFYEESLDNILPTAYEKFLDKDFDLLVTHGLWKSL